MGLSEGRVVALQGPHAARECALLLTGAFACFTQGTVEKRRVENVCHEDPEETSHRGHEAAGAHPLGEADHAERALGLHREVPAHGGAQHGCAWPFVKPHRGNPSATRKTLQLQLPCKGLQITVQGIRSSPGKREITLPMRDICPSLN